MKCTRCIYRKEIPGNAHIRCAHPEVLAEPVNKLAELSAMLGGGRALPFPTKAADKLNITAHIHGVRNGWFAWPYDFDDTWLRNCDGFSAKEDGL